MKKIITLFFVAFMAMNLMAAPTKLAKLNESSVKSEKQENVLRQLGQELWKKDAVVGVNRQEINSSTYHAIKGVKKQEAKTVVLECNEFLVGPEYETGEWYVAFAAEDYTFRLCWYGKANDFTGNYTTEDINMEYSWGWRQTAEVFSEIYYTAVKMTVSETVVSSSLKQIIIDATIEDTNGDIYQLHAKNNIYTPKQTIEHKIANATITMAEGMYVLDGNNAELDVELAVVSDLIEGEYTHTKLDSEMTKILYKGVEQKILQAKLLVIADILEGGDFGYAVAFTFYNQDTVLHKVSMSAPLPKVKDTVKITCTNLEVDNSFASYGFMNVSGSSEEYDVFALYEATSAKAGVYNVSAIITNKETWLDASSISAKLTLVEGDDGWEANIEGYFDDYNWYSVDMKFVIPTPTKTVSVTFDSCALATYNLADDHMLQLLSEGDDFEAAVTVFGVKPGETFTIDNVYMDYTGVYDVEEEFTVQIADINGVLQQNGDTTIITASIIGFNAVQYDVELWYEAPTPVDTVEIDMPIKFTNNLKDGYYTLSSYTPDAKWYIALSPITEEVAGTFVNDGVFGKFGNAGGRYDFYAGNTFVYSAEEEKNYPVEKGEMTVTMDEDGKITAIAKVICRNSVYFHITMTTEYNEYLDFDEPYADLERYYTTDDNVQIDNQVATNTYIFLAITAADGSDMAAFFFYVDKVDPDIIIPVGKYTIDYSEDFGTVQANPGVMGDGVWPSFYAEMDEEGNLVTPLWLMVEGTVEVKKTKDGKPHLVVDAKNSYGRKVYIEYDGSTTDVANVVSDSVDVEKKVVDGQLVIIRDGMTYNVLGIKM